MFENGERSGEGTYKFAKGPTVKGRYKDDKRLKDEVTTRTGAAMTTTDSHDQEDNDD